LLISWLFARLNVPTVSIYSHLAELIALYLPGRPSTWQLMLHRLVVIGLDLLRHHTLVVSDMAQVSVATEAEEFQAINDDCAKTEGRNAKGKEEERETHVAIPGMVLST
jgi:hypothetical protein